jgi:ribosomal protein S17E
MNIYDVYNIICPFSDNSQNKNIKMNILYIAAITDHQALDKLLKFDKKISNKLFKEKLITENFEHNLLTIAMFNNPESVQIINGYNGCDYRYIKDTDDSLDGFEKIIDIQPASWYYLQQSMKLRNYKLKLDLESHWYGYNYKRYFMEENIKKITHYILDKQELGDKTNTCNICDTYKRKVVFTKCRHKVCITCAVHSDKCATCRIHIDENDKILM